LAHAGILPDPAEDVKAGFSGDFLRSYRQFPPFVGKSVQAAHPGIALALTPAVELRVRTMPDKA